MRLTQMKLVLSVVLVCGFLAATAQAQRNELKLGDQAPGLDIEAWLGDEVSIQSGHTYIVLFFSTDDARIDRIFALLSKLQDSLAEERLHVIGVTDEEQVPVGDFARRQGDRASFTLALDRRGSTNRSWLGASKLNDTPAAFLVDARGFIQFMGDPLDQDFPEILELVMFKRYDAKLYEDAEPVIQAMKTARRMRNWRMCMKYLDELIAADEYAFAPKVLEKFEVLLVDMDERERAYEFAREMMTKYADDPQLLGWFAMKIVEDPVIPNDKRDMDIALEMVQAAAPRVDSNDPERYSLQAKVHYHRGELRDAVRLQQKAYLTAPPRRKANFEKVLRQYMMEARRASGSDR